MSLAENLKEIKETIKNDKVTLVVVSKTHPAEKILEVYNAGQRDFGENKVQEMVDKKAQLPDDIRWHMIGHLQRNKVKYIAPFVYLIHGVDSLKLLKEINKEAAKNNRIIDCLLQIHIADEETKFGFSEAEIEELLKIGTLNDLPNIRICGLMGMATNTENQAKVKSEFHYLKALFETLKTGYFAQNKCFEILSMGMSGDYLLAIEEGSTMVRVGSAIFGARNYN